VRQGWNPLRFKGPPRLKSPDTPARHLRNSGGGGEGQGLEAGTVESVALQHKALGDPLDDCVVVARRNDGTSAKLQLQAKRELRLTAAAGNADFRAIVTAGLAALSPPGFQLGADRFGRAMESTA
jgi:hypothetical protein